MFCRQMLRHPTIALFVALACVGLPSKASALAPETAAAKIDELLVKESFGGKEQSLGTLPKRVDDETFLRRVSLDLIGQLPTPEQITAFSLDPDPRKRHLVVNRLLADERFGQNWARYWRDVIFYRRTEDRSLVAARSLVDYLSKQFNEAGRWDRIAQDFITASGDVRENGSTAIIMAQMADPNDTAAEMSRILLGIQIQCAQCHHHPSDRWKRDQFHELAAFFPRIGIRPGVSGEMATFNVISLNRPRGKRAPGGTEVTEVEHYMPDLKDPKAKGKLMQPVFFPTGQKLSTGLSDAERRKQLAAWLTSSGDRWFAKAFVNRMWSELIGHGFYEPVDDLGPDRKCAAPLTLDYLSSQFIANRYDVKWLFRTITGTQAYDREVRPRSDSNVAAMAASRSQRMRGDEVFDALTTALGISEQPLGIANGRKKFAARELFGGPRGVVNQTFGYDPSLRRDEIAGSIPQALWMMNSAEVNRSINARQPSQQLGKILAETRDNESAVTELYLRCLAREPKPTEVETCLSHIRSCKSRQEAFEDIVWSLVNSTEFLFRR